MPGLVSNFVHWVPFVSIHEGQVSNFADPLWLRTGERLLVSTLIQIPPCEEGPATGQDPTGVELVGSYFLQCWVEWWVGRFAHVQFLTMKVLKKMSVDHFHSLTRMVQEY